MVEYDEASPQVLSESRVRKSSESRGKEKSANKQAKGPSLGVKQRGPNAMLQNQCTSKRKHKGMPLSSHKNDPNSGRLVIKQGIDAWELRNIF